jgi:hypothetical protein
MIKATGSQFPTVNDYHLMLSFKVRLSASGMQPHYKKLAASQEMNSVLSVEQKVRVEIALPCAFRIENTL